MQDAPTHIRSLPRARPGLRVSDARCPRAGVRLSTAAACLFALTSPALCGEPAAVDPSETIVRLRATATVTDEQVLLSDVAELDGQAAELVADTTVGPAPHPGSSGSIDAGHIQRILARRGVNLSNWLFRGASRCVVSRTARAPARPEAPAPRPASRLSKPVTPAGSTTRPATPDPETLEGAIYAHLRERLGETGGSLLLRHSPSAAKLLGLSGRQYQFRIKSHGERRLGMVPLEVTILEQGQVRQVVQVVCEASLAQEVVVAGRSINRGELLRPDDLKIEMRTFQKLEDVGLTDAAPLIGQRSCRLIRAGEQLGTRDIEPVPLVERNDLVTVSIRRGGLSITATARAMESGSYGEQVSLRSELSKDSFTGVVMGPKTVVVSDSQSAAEAAAARGER